MLRLLLQGNSRFFSNLKYSRNYLEDLAVDKQTIKKQELVKLEQQKLQNIYDLPANSSNPVNRIRVKTNHKVFTVNPKLDYLQDKCWILQPEQPQIFPKVTISAIRKYIITSLKKAILALRCIKKMHVLDAINQLQRSHKKVAKVMVKTFYNLIDHAIRKNLNPTRLWVHGCIIGKTQRYRHTRYHAKGRGFRAKRDFCQVRVILYEKSQKEYFQQIGTGKCAPGIANVVRHILKSHEADYQTIAKFTGVTTAQGRQQAKLIFKRKVDQIMLENKEKGEYVPKKVLERQVRQQLGQKYRQRFSLLKNEQFSSLRLRERLYKKNMGV